MFVNLNFEFLSFLFTLFIKVANFGLQINEFLLLLVLDTSKNFLLWIKLRFKLSFKLDSVGIGFSDVLVKSCNIIIASVLVISVLNIILLLFCNIAFFKITEGSQKSFNGLVSF